MKKIIQVVLFYVVLILFYITLVTACYVRGVPYLWYFGGETVQDSTIYTGSYYRVGDLVKIVVEEDVRLGEYHKYRLYEFNNGKYVNTDITYYVSVFESKAWMLFMFRCEYNEYKRLQKKSGSLFN